MACHPGDRRAGGADGRFRHRRAVQARLRPQPLARRQRNGPDLAQRVARIPGGYAQGMTLKEVPREAAVGPQSGAARSSSQRVAQAAPLRHPAPRRQHGPLRLPPGDRRCAGVVGGAEGAVDQSEGQADGMPHRGPPDGLRGLRGRHSEGRVRRGPRHRLGPRHVHQRPRHGRGPGARAFVVPAGRRESYTAASHSPAFAAARTRLGCWSRSPTKTPMAAVNRCTASRNRCCRAAHSTSCREGPRLDAADTRHADR